MPHCIDCQKPFPSRIVVEGYQHNLSNRKRCFECAPFKQPRPSRPRTKRERIRIRPIAICVTCQRERHILAKGQCDACHITNSRLVLKILAVQYKGNRCIKCGYDRCLDSLVFHHRNPLEKEFALSGRKTAKVLNDTIKRELDKCDLLCNNCHGEEHAKTLVHWANGMVGPDFGKWSARWDLNPHPSR